MDRVNIFYHMLCKHDFIDRFKKTYSKIQSSGLLNITENIHINCTGEEKVIAIEELKNYDKVIVKVNDNDASESSTLIDLWNFCQTNDSKVLYLHSKGVTRPGNVNVNSWVDYMEYFCITKHEECLRTLDQYDTCGVDLMLQPMKHYSGNFWWVNSSYIKSRNCFDVKQSSNIKDERWYCEFWLLDNENANPVSMHQSGCDLYATNFTKEKYEC